MRRAGGPLNHTRYTFKMRETDAKTTPSSCLDQWAVTQHGAREPYHWLWVGACYEVWGNQSTRRATHVNMQRKCETHEL